MNRLMSSVTASAVCAAMLVGAATEALAQPNAPPPNYQPPPQGYQPPPQGYDQQQPPQGYQPPPPQGYQQQGYAPPPQGYPPQGYQQQQGYQDPALQPPPGYTAQDAQRDATPAERQYDQQYAAAAESWSEANCVRREQNQTAAGAIIGGVLGAVIGSSVAGRHDRGAGAVVGGGLGAIAGGAIASNQGQGPGCPPGFVLRSGAPAFYYGAPPGAAVVVYDAPTWYNPWIWYNGAWIYRPYPYHRYWGEHYRRDYRRR